ncbi:MAG TPA: Gfo/Idh/MocA family oxidoreductase [Bacillota bacterium]|nr:Gfo/Idh/MocA family oxidoreductase [Bacillota bacterium]
MINAAIIGTGGISPAHIEGYLKFPQRCKIVALVDIYPEKAETKKKNFNLDAEIFDSHQALLAHACAVKEDIHLVSICTPPFTHAEIAIDCLKAHKNVILEKPMAASLEECDAILKAAEMAARERAGAGKLSVIAQNRFRTPIMNLKKTLDSGLIGRVLHAQVDSFWWRGHCYYDLWWRGSWEKEGGGCTLNHAVHHIDMLCWMMGLPAEITAVLSNAAHDNAEVEDISVAVLKYPNGSLAQLTSSTIHHGEEQKLIFQGEKAKISAPWDVVASLSKGNGFPERNVALEKEIQDFYEALPNVECETHAGQIDNVLTAIENNTEPLIKGTDGRNTIELITAIYKAGSTERNVKLPITHADEFYTVAGIRKNAKHFYEKSAQAAELTDEAITVGSNYDAPVRKK